MSSPSCPHTGAHGALPAAFHSMGSLARTLFHLLLTFEEPIPSLRPAPLSWDSWFQNFCEGHEAGKQTGK